jgi:hypothetical protein
MIDKAKYDGEAREVINNICSILIEEFDFEVDRKHFYAKDGVSKVLVKNNLMIYFFWDFKEADIVWKFKVRNDDYGHSIDFRNIYKENSFYQGLKSFRKYCFTEKPSIYYERFNPKATEKSYLDFLNKWTNEHPELFHTGDYELIKHLEQRGHQSAESMKTERDLIDKMIKEEKST